MFIQLFLALNTFTAFQSSVCQESLSQPARPEIITIHTDYPKNGIWVQIPKGTKKITINVKAYHTETVLFWKMPTGTQTWNQRKLIGYDVKEDDKDNQFSLTWNIDQPSFLDHLHIQALGEGIANDTINLIME